VLGREPCLHNAATFREGYSSIGEETGDVSLALSQEATTMEYKSVEQLARVAMVNAEANSLPLMSKVQRLQRWAELLERSPDSRLTTFFGTEYRRPLDRDVMRCENSPISVAFADPLLRSQGLADDSYGEARRFFEISDHQLHRILCFCHHGETMSAGAAARAIGQIEKALSRPGIFTRVRQIFAI
jgi:hypothetical protein